MADLLIRHADVITLDAEGRVLRDAEVAISGAQIVAVGVAPEGFQPDEVVDATDHILMPGLFNAHTHAALSLLRGFAEDLPLDRWLNERIWAAEPVFGADDVYWGSSLAMAEMIRSGTVGFADHYFHMDRVAEVVVKSGLRANLAWCAFEAHADMAPDLAGIARFVGEWQGAADGRIRTQLGPHSPYACTPMFLARTAAVAARLGVGIHIHVAESADQVELSRAVHGVSPVELLEQNGVFDVPVLAVHAISLSRGDREILAARSATVVQCPTSYMKLGMGVTPVSQLLADGVRVALGTESPAGNNSLNVMAEARQAALLAKLTAHDPTVLAGDAALRLAAQAGAHALGFPGSGRIEPGNSADLILIDCTTPRLRPRHDLVANVLYAAEGHDVSDVMVDGRWIMRRRSLLTLDEAQILYEAERRGLALARAATHGARSLGSV